MEESKIAIRLEEETKPIKKMCEKLMDAVNHELDKGINNVNAKELGETIDMIKDLYEAKEKMVKACYYKQIMEAMEEHDFEDEEEIMDDGRRGYKGQPRSQSGRFMSRGDGRRSNRGRGGRRGYEDEMYYPMTTEMYNMPIDYLRDMDREAMNRMYYSGGGSSSGGSGMSGGSSGGNMGGGSMGSSGGGSRGYSDGNYGGNDGNRGGGNSRYENARRGYEEKKNMGADKQEKMKSLEEYMKELSTDVSNMVTEMSPEEKSLMKQKMSVLMSKIS